MAVTRSHRKQADRQDPVLRALSAKCSTDKIREKTRTPSSTSKGLARQKRKPRSQLIAAATAMKDPAAFNNQAADRNKQCVEATKHLLERSLPTFTSLQVDSYSANDRVLFGVLQLTSGIRKRWKLVDKYMHFPTLLQQAGRLAAYVSSVPNVSAPRSFTLPSAITENGFEIACMAMLGEDISCRLKCYVDYVDYILANIAMNVNLDIYLQAMEMFEKHVACTNLEREKVEVVEYAFRMAYKLDESWVFKTREMLQLVARGAAEAYKTLDGPAKDRRGKVAEEDYLQLPQRQTSLAMAHMKGEMRAAIQRLESTA